MSVPLPVDADYSFVEINVENYFFCDERNQPFSLSFGDHHIVGTGFQQIRDPTKFGSVAMHYLHSFEVRPVVRPVFDLGQLGARNGYLAIEQFCRLVPVIHTLESCNDRLAMLFSFAQQRNLPLTVALQEPAIIVKDRFAWLGVRVNLDPAFYSEKAGNSAQQYRLFQFPDQLLA